RRARLALWELFLRTLRAPAVSPGKDALAGGVGRRRLGGQLGGRDPAPARGADGLAQPRLADRTRVEPCATVARTFHRRGELHGRTRTKIVEREPQRVRDAAADRQRPRVRIDRGNVVVDQQVVKADGGDVVSQRLERHAVTPRRKLQLLERDSPHQNVKSSTPPLTFSPTPVM